VIDCGLYQGVKPLRLRNWAKLPFEPASLDAVLLTHAHVDHSGYLPALKPVGLLGMPAPPRVHPYGEQTARAIDCAIREIVGRAFRSARGILERNRALLEGSARELLERETLSEAELQPWFEKMETAAP
jgi:glyoxylase-like metal-dependent hydrolase (beta-lactamase superfamily II)